MVNSELRGEQIVVKHYVNMGSPCPTRTGSSSRAEGADTMNLLGMARGSTTSPLGPGRRSCCGRGARGTFTITNPGPFGSLISVPIINQPESAILGFDTVEKRPV